MSEFLFMGSGFFHLNELLPSANPKVLNHCENSGEVLCCGAFLPVIQFESGRRGGRCGCSLANGLVGRFCGVQASSHTLVPELQEENACIFLFHKINFRNCSHPIALILRRKTKNKTTNSFDASELVWKLATLNLVVPFWWCIHVGL